MITDVRGKLLWLTPLLLMAFALIAPGAATAATYRWQVDASGNWNVPGNWEVVEGPAGAGYPNLAGDVAVIDEPLTAARTITIPDGVTITVGQLTVASSNAAGKVTIARDGTGLLAFDNPGEVAVVEMSGPGQRTVLSTPIRLAAHLAVSGAIDFNAISESVASRNVTIAAGSVAFTQLNTYTGTTTVTDGELTTPVTIFVVGVSIPGPLVVGDGTGTPGSASVRITAGSLAQTTDVRVNADGLATFLIHPDLFNPANHLFDELTVAGGKAHVLGNATKVFIRDLIMEGGEVRLDQAVNGLYLMGSVTATSTAAGPALVSSGTNLNGVPGVFALQQPVNHDFTIADGPEPIDFRVDTALFVGFNGASLSKRGPGVMRIGDGAMTAGTSVFGGTLQVNGTAGTNGFAWSGPVQVAAQTTLIGAGAVGPITVEAGATLSPGFPVGVMGSGALAFFAGGHFAVQIGGAGTYDRMNVTGTVSLGNATLDVTSAFPFPPTATFTIIDNDGSDAVVGTFAGLPEGATFTTASGVVFQISYHGGDGNDVVLANITPLTYFLSEGATGTFFDEDVLIANPNTVAAPVTMTFFLPGGGIVTRQAIVPAQSRLTVKVDEIQGLEATTPSVEVRSDNRLTLAVERTMFWDSTHYGGHTANSVSRAERRWFFAEGAQNDFFNTFLLLSNPGGGTMVTLTFLRENEPPFVFDRQLPAASRTTINAGDYAALVGRSFGIVVDALGPITAERAMYFASTPQRLWSGGHDNVGSPEASTSWFHPEGASGTFFTTFILLSNPQDEPATVHLKFLLPGGIPPELTKTIPPRARLTINPATQGLGPLENASFSTVVTSTVPIVSERAMYWNTDDTPFGEGHASSGLTTTALEWTLAEGRVGGTNAYTTYILLANPQISPAEVKVTYLRESGTAIVKTYTVGPNARFNIDVGAMVPELQNESFGALIEVTNDVPIAVERSLYWNVDGRFWSGGTNAVGAIVPR